MNQPAHLYADIGGYLFCITDVLGTYQVVPMSPDLEDSERFIKCYKEAQDLLSDELKNALLIADLAIDKDFCWGHPKEPVVYNKSIKAALECDYLYENYKAAIVERSEWVYVLEAVGYGLYKIGMTARQPEIRTAEYSPRLPFDTNITAQIPTPNGLWLESQIHERFKANRIRGEWFNLNDKEVKMLVDLSVDYKWKR